MEPRLRFDGVSPLGEDHCVARFHAPELDFVAGQWINLHAHRGGEEKQAKALSFASEPALLPRVELCVRCKADSVVIPRLESAAPGEEFEYDGPYGAFKHEGAFDGPCLFIASSTGIAPIRGVLRDATNDASPAVPGRVLHAVCLDADHVYAEEEADWQVRWPGLEIERMRCEGSSESAIETWEPLLARVRRALEEGPEAPRLFLAGHGAWIKPLRAELKQDWGIDRRSVKAEIFWP